MAANFLYFCAISMGDQWHSYIGSTSVLPDIYKGETTIVILMFMFSFLIVSPMIIAWHLMVPTQFPSTAA